MNGPLLFHVSAALFVSLLAALGGAHLLALGVAAYAVLVAVNKTSGIADAVAYVVIGAFTVFFGVVAVISFNSGRYFDAVVILTGLTASWAWTLLRRQKV